MYHGSSLRGASAERICIPTFPECSCKLCGEECESVVHVLWECPVFDTIRNTFMGELDNLLGRNFEEFSALNNFKRTGFVLGCEKW